MRQASSSRHQCLPMTADWDLDGECDERRARAKVLDDLAQRIERTLPVEKRYGTLAWAGALGVF